MQEKPVLVFLKTYDLSSAPPRTLLDFFDTDEACVPTTDVSNPLEDAVRMLYRTVPPEAVLTESVAVSRAKMCDLETPEASALCVLRNHPLPDGNKRLAFLLFLYKYIYLYDEPPCCRSFGKVIARWLQELNLEGEDEFDNEC